MKDYIVDRVLNIAEYIMDTGATVRTCAGKFRISKTTVHKDMRERLPEIRPSLAKEVNRILEENKSDRHIRGGRATKMKYEAEQEKRVRTL